MEFQSTRSALIRADGPRAVLQGLAPDGGLYIEKELQRRPFDWRACLKLPPLAMAEMVLEHLLPGFEDMGLLVRRAYEGKFASPELTPLVPVGEDYVLELFHGPTSAFKDVALSMLPQLMTAARSQAAVDERIIILTATSGDTGKAALKGFQDVDGTGIIVFYPDGGVSPVQKAQMVSQEGRNLKVCALRGNFDDCQRGVKEAFARLSGDKALEKEGLRLSSANSINIGRLAPQAVYYFIAYSRLCALGRIKPGEPVDFSVPTGNFGDILAGYYAKLMGLPVGRLICASNANRVLTDFFATGVYDRRRDFVKTSSPSMDILVSSNLERLLFLASGGDCDFVKSSMEKLGREGFYSVPEPVMENIRAVFSAGCCDEERCGETIGRVWRELGYLCDPHTAVAFAVAEEQKKERGDKRPMVVLSTASPYKFPGPVLEAIGLEPGGDEFFQMEALSRETGLPIPPGLAGLRGKKTLHRDLIGPEALTEYILDILRKGEV